MIVTINTDASFSQKHQIGSFAFWIVCNEFRILKSGILKSNVVRPELAEFKCIVNAFHTLFNQDIRGIKKIIVNTDCLNVIHVINDSKPEISRYKLGFLKEVLKPYKKIISKHPSVTIEFRHVRSHTGKGDARSYVNEWCDTEAKKKIREKLEALNKPNLNNEN